LLGHDAPVAAQFVPEGIYQVTGEGVLNAQGVTWAAGTNALATRLR